MVRAVRKTGGTPAKETLEWKPTALRVRRLKMRWKHDVKHDSKIIQTTNGKTKLKIGMNGGGGGEEGYTKNINHSALTFKH